MRSHLRFGWEGFQLALAIDDAILCDFPWWQYSSPLGSEKRVAQELEL